MVGWLLDVLAASMGSGSASEPCSLDEASERFFVRTLMLLLGSALTAAGALATWLASSAFLRQAGIVALILGGLLVLSSIARLVQLWRAAKVLRRTAGQED
jgi:hypothetical protein